VPLHVAHECSSADFTLADGQRIVFTLSHGASVASAPPPPDAEAALRETTRWWQDWAARFDKPTPWRDAVMRSLITLKALTHHRTGGLIAAPTTSLPEVPGGAANWDYRFCWLRDATFTLSALLNAGYHEEAHAWREWMLRAVAGSPERLKIMYRVDGGRQTQEWEAHWLPGHDGARPVRIGNAAAEQRQIDVFGELLDALHLAARAGIAETDASRHLEGALAERIAQIWQKSGQGLWESRGEPQQYTYSKVMCWAGLDRFVRGIEGRKGTADPTRWRTLRDEIHATVCEQGFDAASGHFGSTFGADTLDASLLLLPIVGFLPATDPRIAATIAAIERELTEDGLVYRKPPGPSGHKQGAFIACCCWLADCQRLQGRREAAVATLERVLALRNDLGLLSEEYDLPQRRLIGNFPQALSHLGLVNTALGLSGPVLTRGGG
jgi:GH15 family glucan-1,4-alpha-glucosidase